MNAVTFGKMTRWDEHGNALQDIVRNGRRVGVIEKTTRNAGSILCPQWVAESYTVIFFNPHHDILDAVFDVECDRYGQPVRGAARGAGAKAKAHARYALAQVQA